MEELEISSGTGSEDEKMITVYISATGHPRGCWHDLVDGARS